MLCGNPVCNYTPPLSSVYCVSAFHRASVHIIPARSRGSRAHGMHACIRTCTVCVVVSILPPLGLHAPPTKRSLWACSHGCALQDIATHLWIMRAFVLGPQNSSSPFSLVAGGGAPYAWHASDAEPQMVRLVLMYTAPAAANPIAADSNLYLVPGAMNSRRPRARLTSSYSNLRALCIFCLFQSTEYDSAPAPPSRGMPCGVCDGCGRCEAIVANLAKAVEKQRDLSNERAGGQKSRWHWGSPDQQKRGPLCSRLGRGGGKAAITDYAIVLRGASWGASAVGQGAIVCVRV